MESRHFESQSAPLLTPLPPCLAAPSFWKVWLRPCYYLIIHPINRFKSSDWLKEGHMTWIIFDNVHVWKLIHVCCLLLFPLLSKKPSQLPNLELDILSRFDGSLQTKKSMNGVYKTNIDCSFIRGKFNLGLLFTEARRAEVNSRPRLTPGGAVKYEVDTGVRPALQQAGTFGESTGSKNEGSLGESMIFGIQWEKNTKICGVIGWEPKVFSILDCKITKVKYIVFFSNASFWANGHWVTD